MSFILHQVCSALLAAFRTRLLAPMIIFSASTAQAAIVITEAKIASGRLIVTGTSDIGDRVELDAYYRADVVNKSFSFNLVYIPPSCIVSIGASGTTTPNVRAVIANCAPMPFNAMGQWQSEVRYQPNDLVERNNNTYVALANARANLNEDPLIASSFWRVLPSQQNSAERTLIIGPKGERGEAGQVGAKGDKGEDGALANKVLYTIKAEIQRRPADSGQSTSDWQITSSGSLQVKIAKGEKYNSADILIEAPHINDLRICSLTANLFSPDPSRSGSWIGPLAKRGDVMALPIAISSEQSHLEAILLCPEQK